MRTDVESDSEDEKKKSISVATTMAGRGKGNSLQHEVYNQGEWDKLIERKGLGVIDIYSKWCGPCKAIISLFRKIRNEQQDDFLFFATAETDNIESLAAYRGKSQPTFLFFADGQIVNVLRGCDGPLITKMISLTKDKERKIAEGIIERVTFIDKVVSTEPEPDEKQDIVKEVLDEAEEELAKDMTCRKSGGSHLKFESVLKQVSVVIVKPDAVAGGHVDFILEEIGGAGYDVLQKSEVSLTHEQVAELYKQDNDGDNFEQLIEFMTSGPSVVLAVVKNGDIVGEEIISELATLCGPSDVNIAKEDAPESLRAKYGTDSLRNGIGSSLSLENASRELAIFFPDLEIPLAKHLIQQKTLQRTVALIRPNAYGQKDDIVKAIEESGFLIAIQKEITFSKEIAEEFYSQYKEEESFDGLIASMTSGPSFALCLVKNHAIQAWKDELLPKEVEEGEEGTVEPSLQQKFTIAEESCPPLHASDSSTDFEREMKLLFPMENALAVIQPDTYMNEEARGVILATIKQAGFNVVIQKEVTLSVEQAQLLCKDCAESAFYKELMQYMCSGISQVLVLSREDAIGGLQCLLGPAQPEAAKESAPESLRAQFGQDVVRHAVYASVGKDGVSDLIKELCPDAVFDKSGLVSEPAPATEESSGSIAETPAAESEQVAVEPEAPVEETPEANTEETTEAGQLTTDEPATDAPASTEETAEKTASAEQPTTTDETTDDSSAPTSREPTTDGPTETTSPEASREGTTLTEGETTTSNDADTDTT